MVAQAPGLAFFAPDGGSIAGEDQQRIQLNLDVVNGLDMLPVVVLFDPACKLASATDRCEDAAFGDGIKLARGIGAAE